MLTGAAEPTEPRADDPDLRSVPAGFFALWRRSVSAIASAPRRVGPLVRARGLEWTRRWREVRAYHATSSLPWNPADHEQRRVAAAAGLRAFIAGLIVAGIVVSATTSLWLPIAVGVAGQVLWAAARFIIIAMLMPRGTIDRSRLSIAYLAGLLPYAVAATWLLQLAALGVSAALTRRGLVGAGVGDRDAKLAVAWAFGGQVVITAGGWALRGLVVLVAG